MLILDVLSPDDPGRAFAILRGGDDSGADLAEHSHGAEAKYLSSLPGIGRINLATLLSEASGPLSRRDYQALRTLSGVAPVTKRSGKSHIVVMRYASHV